jgi:hypothetical protein
MLLGIARGEKKSAAFFSSLKACEASKALK